MDDIKKQTHTIEEEKLGLEGSGSSLNFPVYNELELLSETDMSFGAILKGTAANPLTDFERKAALINAELDKFGMGKYQICIWFLCGMGYFVDLAWARGVSLIASAVFQEMDVPDKDTGRLWVCANAGLALGALFFGLVVDVVGRKWAFYLTCLITSVCGLFMVSSLLSLSRS